MQRAMLQINGIPTQVITEGRWVEEGLAEYGKKDIVLVITGNPGIAEFYEGFIKTIKSRLPSEVPVWVVGNAGHVQPPNNLAITMPNNSTWNEHYSLMAQLEHKVFLFIKFYCFAEETLNRHNLITERLHKKICTRRCKTASYWAFNRELDDIKYTKR